MTHQSSCCHSASISLRLRWSHRGWMFHHASGCEPFCFCPWCGKKLAIPEGHRLGPNHRDGCTGSPFYLSGVGYNRVRVCACGAEDHAADFDAWKLGVVDLTNLPRREPRFTFDEPAEDVADGC